MGKANEKKKRGESPGGGGGTCRVYDTEKVHFELRKERRKVTSPLPGQVQRTSQHPRVARKGGGKTPFSNVRGGPRGKALPPLPGGGEKGGGKEKKEGSLPKRGSYFTRKGGKEKQFLPPRRRERRRSNLFTIHLEEKEGSHSLLPVQSCKKVPKFTRREKCPPTTKGEKSGALYPLFLAGGNCRGKSQALLRIFSTEKDQPVPFVHQRRNRERTGVNVFERGENPIGYADPKNPPEGGERKKTFALSGGGGIQRGNDR